jgi:chitin disaccharide deacetylase
VSSLAEALGYAPDAKLLIVNADDLGSSHAANVGVYEALREGIATSATLMVPCPWARDAAARYRGEDVGVHLTLNSEWDLYRWGPITYGPSLLDGDGGFPRTVEDVWDHADIDEVRRELRAQVERAILWGFDVSHLDSHMGTVQLRPEFFDVYLELAVDFRLPLRLSGSSSEGGIGFPFRRLAAEEGVLFPDHFLHVRGRGTRHVLERALFDLKPGVTEIYGHPAVDTPELRALAPDWPNRVDDHDLFVRDHAIREMAARAGVRFIGYREMRDLMRTNTRETTAPTALA